jgi:ElaB/YqjD/DUF883 family membrane-anchored ribosome-binding protein
MTTNGEAEVAAAAADTAQVKEHLRAARDAAASAARARASQAQDWARAQLDDIQQKVEAQPYRASAWALGAGFLAGILLMSVMRNSRTPRYDRSER